MSNRHQNTLKYLLEDVQDLSSTRYGILNEIEIEALIVAIDAFNRIEFMKEFKK
jgi:hypothetical protein